MVDSRKALGALALILSMGAGAARADVITFAQFTEQSNSTGTNFRFSNNGNGTGTFNTASSSGDSVYFTLDPSLGAPADLSGPLKAYLLINNGAGTITSGAATYSGGAYSQLFDTPFTISFVLATPVLFEGQLVSNLLTINVNPNLTTPSLSGAAHSGTMAIDNANYGLTYSSSILRFTPDSSLDFALSFSSILGVTGKNKGILKSFTANGTGTFDSDPSPQVPEPASVALLVAGLTASAVAARRRA